MIFVTLGNVPCPFLRLAEAADALAQNVSESVMIQAGHTYYEFKHALGTDFLAAAEMERIMREASVVVTHGGWGTISEAMRMEKRIVAVPRAMGVEHNHDQAELVAALAAQNLVLAVDDIANLPQVIETARTHDFAAPTRGDASQVINDFLRQVFK
jgi:UDP-N-acetylglucosamine transferase subunit ALG13